MPSSISAAAVAFSPPTRLPAAMPVIYTLIARPPDNLLIDATNPAHTGNFSEISKKILANIPAAQHEDHQKVTFVFEGSEWQSATAAQPEPLQLLHSLTLFCVCPSVTHSIFVPSVVCCSCACATRHMAAPNRSLS